MRNQKGEKEDNEHERLIFQNSEICYLENGILEKTKNTAVTAVVNVHNPTSLFRRKLHKCRPSRAAELWETSVSLRNRGRDVFFNAQYN